jgi:hypothetical protein
MSGEGIPLLGIQRQLGHADLGITSACLRGIDNTKIIHAVRERPAPVIPAGSHACSQGAALQAFADAYKATKNRFYLAVGERALALFTVAPPAGVAVKTPLGARYVEYSFDPAQGDEVLNAFLQSLIGLHDFAQTSRSWLAARLFAARQRRGPSRATSI